MLGLIRFLANRFTLLVFNVILSLASSFTLIFKSSVVQLALRRRAPASLCGYWFLVRTNKRYPHLV